MFFHFLFLISQNIQALFPLDYTLVCSSLSKQFNVIFASLLRYITNKRITKRKSPFKGFSACFVKREKGNITILLFDFNLPCLIVTLILYLPCGDLISALFSHSQVYFRSKRCLIVKIQSVNRLRGLAAFYACRLAFRVCLVHLSSGLIALFDCEYNAV